MKILIACLLGLGIGFRLFAQEKSEEIPSHVDHFVMEIPLDEEGINFYHLILSEGKILSLSDLIRKGFSLGELSLASLMNPSSGDVSHTSAYYKFIAKEYTAAADEFRRQADELSNAEDSLLKSLAVELVDKVKSPEAVNATDIKSPEGPIVTPFTKCAQTSIQAFRGYNQLDSQLCEFHIDDLPDNYDRRPLIPATHIISWYEDLLRFEDSEEDYLLLSMPYFSVGIRGESIEILLDLWLFARSELKKDLKAGRHEIAKRYFSQLGWIREDGRPSDLIQLKIDDLCRQLERALYKGYLNELVKGDLCV